MAILDYYNRTVTVFRNETTRDAAQGVVRTPTQIGVFLGRQENLSGNQLTYQDRNSANVFERIWVDATIADIIELDVVDVKDRETDVLIKKYTVRRVQPAQQTQLLHHLELDIEVHT